MNSRTRQKQDKYSILRGLLRLWYTEQTRRTGHQKDKLAVVEIAKALREQ